MYTPGSFKWTGAHHGSLWFLVALSKFVWAIKLLQGTQNYWYCDHGGRIQVWEEISSIQKAIWVASLINFKNNTSLVKLRVDSPRAQISTR